MTEQDKILVFLKSSGPTLPSKVAKNLGTNILLASAHLADLKSQGKINISNLKVGGSPLYFLPGQEEQLYPFAAGNINEKDLRILDKLKQNQVLREEELEVLAKVSLRSLKDFAVPLHVTVSGKKEVFWKWGFLSEEETNGTISKMLTKEVPVQPEPNVTPPKVKEESKEEPVETTKVDEEVEDSVEVEEKTIEPEKKELTNEETELEKVLSDKAKAIKKPILKKIKDKITRRRPVQDKFLPVLEDFFKKMEIRIDKKETVRKNSEMNFFVKVPSIVGEMTYFCKAKSKARCDEKDISTAYMEAQIKKLPLLFLYAKEINKKAQEMLKSDAFENVVVKKIE